MTDVLLDTTQITLNAATIIASDDGDASKIKVSNDGGVFRIELDGATGKITARGTSGNARVEITSAGVYIRDSSNALVASLGSNGNLYFYRNILLAAGQDICLDSQYVGDRLAALEAAVF